MNSINEILAAGWQVIHTVGEARDFVDPQVTGYHVMPYCDRMDLALAAADLVIARSGAATVSELAGLGIPAVFVPYPVGNGEQELNACDSVTAGGEGSFFKPYETIDASIRYDFGAFGIYAEAGNLTNEKQIRYTGAPEAIALYAEQGRRFAIGANFKF